MTGVHQALLSCAIGDPNTYCCYASDDCCDNAFTFLPGTVDFVNITGNAVSSTQSPTSSTAAKSEKAINATAIGVSVGAPLGTLLLLAIMLLLWERRKRIEMEDRWATSSRIMRISSPILEVGSGDPGSDSPRAELAHRQPNLKAWPAELHGGD
ncbi:MAG: hypothetical protein M1840_005130 [Geoglossum simile]|nr:MAG: hypothetical protein M1840_005130 [Geoglossum simile]